MIETGVVVSIHHEPIVMRDDVRRLFPVAWNAKVKVRCTRCRRVCSKTRQQVMQAVQARARGMFCSQRCSAFHQRERHYTVVDGVTGRVCSNCNQWKPEKQIRRSGTICRGCWNREPRTRFHEYRRRARHGFVLTFDQFMQFWQRPCWYCGDVPETIGLDRIDNSKGYTLSNVVSCCRACNLAKLDADREEFLARCRRIASRHPGAPT